MGWGDEKRQKNGNSGRSGLWIFLGKRVFWISGKEKVILNKRDRTSKDSGVGRKKPVTGNMTGIFGFLG